MRLFIVSSVLLAAAGSAKGASRFVLNEAEAHGWELISSDYCVEEIRRNLPKLGRVALSGWKLAVSPRLEIVRASLALDWSHQNCRVPTPTIIHLDADAFFVSCELALKPERLCYLNTDNVHGC